MGLTSALVAQLLEMARQAQPHEIVGLLSGPKQDQARLLHAIANVAATPATRYEADPMGLVRAISHIRREGLTLVAVYHSHPNGPATPSRTDIAQASWDVPYIIVDAKHGVLRAWRLLPQPQEVLLEVESQNLTNQTR